MKNQRAGEKCAANAGEPKMTNARMVITISTAVLSPDEGVVSESIERWSDDFERPDDNAWANGLTDALRRIFRSHGMERED